MKTRAAIPTQQRPSNRPVWAWALPLLLALTGCALSVVAFLRGSPPLAYIDTSRLMVGFSEANKAQRELKEDSKTWQSQLKVLQDSVQSAIDTMSTYYDTATPSRKRALQDKLSAWNQRANNFRLANQKKMKQLEAEKMKAVVDKVNVYLQEYGRKHKYAIIFGTAAGGSILYGDGERHDMNRSSA